ncbi:MAG: bifunctional 5,10-methylene-tetrahydrofolate dehydrogenase/5,10-methylene-tetrahydrofolate cyclohydrolase [Chloroflexota bacterium]|nr:bifunctional 5,10-methylene-tetrahydrofolate dehydrogenase/5,10-methylene-tetrahydrofolate cyclohydrolase [Chloroflexota bacterium]
MTATIIDGAAIAAGIREALTRQVEDMIAGGLLPHLAVILVGDNPASASYVTGKQRAGQETGIKVVIHKIEADPEPQQTERRIRDRIDLLNADPDVHGVILQLPVPEGVHSDVLLERIDPLKDVDGLHPANQGRILQGRERYLPATPHGVQQLLVRSGADPAGKHVVIVGRSRLVGMPLAAMLAQKRQGANATVTVCHTNTIDLPAITREADILVAATGRPGTITAGMVRAGVTVIDVGVNRVDDVTRKRGYRLVGDVDFDSVSEVAGAITPVPGGVGPMTVAMLLNNVTRAARISQQR